MSDDAGNTARIIDAAGVWTDAMDRAVALLQNRGVEFGEMRVEQREILGTTDFPDWHRVLIVQGEPTFEVTSRWTRTGEHEYKCTHTPRAIVPTGE